MVRKESIYLQPAGGVEHATANATARTRDGAPASRTASSPPNDRFADPHRNGYHAHDEQLRVRQPSQQPTRQLRLAAVAGDRPVQPIAPAGRAHEPTDP